MHVKGIAKAIKKVPIVWEGLGRFGKVLGIVFYLKKHEHVALRRFKAPLCGALRSHRYQTKTHGSHHLGEQFGHKISSN